MMSRTWNYRWRRGLSLAGLLVVLQTVIACMASQGPLVGTVPTDTPVNRLERGLMDATDLPFGWRRESSGVPRDLRGEVARYRDYRGPTGSPIFVRAGQSIALYSTLTDSEAAYKETAANEIPAAYADHWLHPTELDISHHADEITIGCLDGVFNGISARSCRVITRYGLLVTIVNAQVFEDRWLTMAQFRHLLERVDAKMEAIREPQTDAPSTPAP